MTGDHTNTLNDGNNASILVVDDERDIANLIKRSLEIDGLRVCSFTDPFVALDHFKSDPKKDQHSVIFFSVLFF